MRRKNPAPGAVGLRNLYNRYKYGARTRGYRWDLDEETFKTLTSQPCHYCGKPPSQVSSQGSHVSLERRKHSAYLYNGLDRVDNDIGYLPDNLVPSCGTCNVAKQTMTQLEFFEWLKLAAEHSKLLAPRLTPDEATAMVKAMREAGVLEFTMGGFTAKLDPHMGAPMPKSIVDDDPNVAAEKLKAHQAIENFFAENKTSDEDLLWSV